MINSDYELVLRRGRGCRRHHLLDAQCRVDSVDNTLLTALFTWTENLNNLAKES